MVKINVLLDWQLNLKVLLLFIILFSAPVSASVSMRLLTADGKPLKDAVIMVNGEPKVASKPMSGQQIVQQQKMFVPDLLVVTKDTPVFFPNHDTVRHHVYSFSAAKAFEIKLYVGTPSDPVVFDKPGVAILGCNIHDEMIAWVVVVDTPFFAVTDSNGEIVLNNIPQGSYSISMWHKALFTEQAIKLGDLQLESTTKLVELKTSQDSHFFEQL